MLKSTCTLSGSKFDAPQGEEAVLPEQMDAAVRLALDRQSMFYEDKEAADGLCRPKMEKKPRRNLVMQLVLKFQPQQWNGNHGVGDRPQKLDSHQSVPISA